MLKFPFSTEFPFKSTSVRDDQLDSVRWAIDYQHWHLLLLQRSFKWEIFLLLGGSIVLSSVCFEDVGESGTVATHVGNNPASKVKSRSQWNFPWGGISQEIMEKSEMSRVGYVRHPIWTTHYKKRPKTAENELILRNFLQFGTMSAWKKIKGGI